MEALQVIEAVDDVIEIHVKVLRLEIMMSIWVCVGRLEKNYNILIE